VEVDGARSRCLEILIASVYFILPLHPGGHARRSLRRLHGSPSAEEVPFDWKFVNYAPILAVGLLLVLVDRLAPVGQEVVRRPEDGDRPARGRLLGGR